MFGWSPYLWIILIGLALYAKTVFFGFTYMDDDSLILNNYPFISNISNILQAFRHEVFRSPGFSSFYRPMLIISFIFDAHISGPFPFMYHLSNIFIHIAASCLLFLFLTMLQHRKELALFFSVLFMVHPALTQAVAWIPGRNDSLLAVFSLLSFITLLNFLKADKMMWYLLHILFLGLALFTKESAVALILLYVVYLHVILKEKPFSLREIRLMAGWFIAAAFWFLLRHAAIEKPLNMTIFELARNIFVNSPALVQYIGKIVFPFNLSVFPIIQNTSFVYGIAAVGLLLAAILFSKKRRYNFIMFGALWCVIFLLPSIIRPVRVTQINYFLEHRLYLPMIGFILVLLETDAVKKVNFKNKFIVALCVLAICVFSFISFRHSEDFKNTLNFWSNAARNSPDSAVVRANLAAAYMVNGMTDNAEVESRRAVLIDPQAMGVHNVLGYVYMNRDMFKEAESEFKKEIVLNPLFSSSYANLGLLYCKEGRPKDAVPLWLKALDLDRDDVSAIKNLAIYYYQEKEYEKAFRYVRRLIELGVEVPQEVLKTLENR